MVRPIIVMNTAYDTHNSRECDILIGAYAERVYESGGDPLLAPTIGDREFLRRSLAPAHGVLLIGGKDYPPSFYGEEPHPRTNLARMRSECDLWFGECALASSLPVFGICAGCQLLAILDGGKLIQHLDNADDVHTAGKIHSATVVADGWLSRILRLSPGDDFTVNSFHHQAVRPETLKRFRVTARAFDGSVEAIELPDPERMVLAVQFHPERMDDIGPDFFTALTEQASLRRQTA